MSDRLSIEEVSGFIETALVNGFTRSSFANSSMANTMNGTNIPDYLKIVLNQLADTMRDNERLRKALEYGLEYAHSNFPTLLINPPIDTKIEFLRKAKEALSNKESEHG